MSVLATDERGSRAVAAAWERLIGEGVYPSMARLRGATGFGPHRIMALRDELIRSGRIGLPEQLRDRDRGMLPAAVARYPSDAEIEECILAEYTRCAAAGLTRPTERRLKQVCGTKSSRVADARIRLTVAGHLPDLPVGTGQPKAMTRVRSGLYAGRPPAPARPKCERPDLYPLEPVVREAMARERRRATWAIGVSRIG